MAGLTLRKTEIYRMFPVVEEQALLRFFDFYNKPHFTGKELLFAIKSLKERFEKKEITQIEGISYENLKPFIERFINDVRPKWTLSLTENLNFEEI
jgi:hypothetical protein